MYALRYYSKVYPDNDDEYTISKQMQTCPYGMFNFTIANDDIEVPFTVCTCTARSIYPKDSQCMYNKKGRVSGLLTYGCYSQLVPFSLNAIHRGNTGKYHESVVHIRS